MKESTESNWEQLSKDIDSTRKRLEELTKRVGEEILWLRQLLWLNHGCDIMHQYGDDGEMQCAFCMVDFKRETLPIIEEKLRKRTPHGVT